MDALEEPEPRPNVAHPPQVMVAGAVSWWGQTSLIRVSSGLKITKEVYIDTLEEGVLPKVKELCRGNRWTFVHDGAHAHRAKKDQGMA